MGELRSRVRAQQQQEEREEERDHRDREEHAAAAEEGPQAGRVCKYSIVYGIHFSIYHTLIVVYCCILVRHAPLSNVLSIFFLVAEALSPRRLPPLRP